MEQYYLASSIGNLAGPTYRAMLTWSPSRLVDIHFNVEQVVTESWDTSATGILANAVQAGVDYEFRPNIVLSTTAVFEEDHFKGQLREDKVYGVDTRITYLLNNITSISLQYRFTRRDSNIPDVTFQKTRSESMLQLTSDYNGHTFAANHGNSAVPTASIYRTVDLRAYPIISRRRWIVVGTVATLICLAAILIFLSTTRYRYGHRPH